MEYSCDVCEGVSNRNLDMLDKLQKWICSKNVGLHLLFFLSRRLIVESIQFTSFLQVFIT